MRTTRGRLGRALLVGAVLVGTSAGLLWGADRGPRGTTGALRVAAAASETRALPTFATGGVAIVSPQSDERLRGVATVRVSWDDPTGYVMYRVDGQFAYATSSPFEMQWDTSNASDGEHVVTADAYDSDAVYQGSSSVKLIVENRIPTPTNGVRLQVRFRDSDLFSRQFQGRSELSALAADQALPPGFDLLTGDFRCDLTQSVMDTYYEGTSTLLRNRVRQGSIVVAGATRALPEVGQYAMVQISPNGLALPAAAAVKRARIGLGEVSLALPDRPVFPGDTWEAPLGAVCDLYTRQGVYVLAQHTFEGLRWFRGHECAVITSSYTVPKMTVFDASSSSVASAAAAVPAAYQVGLTQRGAMGMRGDGARGGRRTGGQTGARGTQAAPGTRQQTQTRTTRPSAATRSAGGAPVALATAQLRDLKGTRQTYLTRVTGRILHTEDTILGKVEFRGARQQASAPTTGRYAVKLTQRGGMRGEMGGRGQRSGQARGGTRAGGAGRQQSPTATRSAQPSVQVDQQLPPSLDYGLRLTSDLVVK